MKTTFIKEAAGIRMKSTECVSEQQTNKQQQQLQKWIKVKFIEYLWTSRKM